jgi:hypothetical protein
MVRRPGAGEHTAPPSSPRPGSAAVALAVVLALVAFLGACTDDTDDTGGSPATTAPAPVGPPGATDTGQAPTTPPGDPGSEATPTGGPDGTVPIEATYPGPVNAPVALDATADFGDGLTARVTGVRAVDVEAGLRGETSGPGVELTLELSNGGGAPVDVDNVTVDLQDRSGASATAIASATATPLSGTLPPGASRTGTYVFRISDSERTDARVIVKYSSERPAVAFVGSIPNG